MVVATTGNETMPNPRAEAQSMVVPATAIPVPTPAEFSFVNSSRLSPYLKLNSSMGLL
jgi:hypothetical protein